MDKQKTFKNRQSYKQNKAEITKQTGNMLRNSNQYEITKPHPEPVRENVLKYTE